MSPYNVKFIQKSLPGYRFHFFDRLFDHPDAEGKVYFSSEKPFSHRHGNENPRWAHEMKSLLRLPFGFDWQPGVFGIPLSRGDLLVVGGNPRNLTILCLVIKAKMQRVTVVWWSHYWSSTSKSWRFRVRLMMMRLADALVFYVDEEVAEYHHFTGGRDTRPITALNNGIELDGIREIRAKYYDIGSRLRDLVFIGRITPKSELKLLIDALANSRCQHVTLDVIGDGADAAELGRHADYIGVGDRIRWHGAVTDERDIGRVMNECKAFVYPGSVGLSLIHGLAYGLPCIVHDDRWRHMPEIAALSPGDNGVAFKRGSVASLAESIDKLLSDPDELRRMSANARETTENRFNTEGMADRLHSLLKEISKID